MMRKGNSVHQLRCAQRKHPHLPMHVTLFLTERNTKQKRMQFLTDADNYELYLISIRLLALEC
ncbi:hypothetical protein AHF37_10473 [Paragonimus kellicotti]|nr:hypothetical protein AHF37_10473 [Paragonimus kellicotti]